MTPQEREQAIWEYTPEPLTPEQVKELEKKIEDLPMELEDNNYGYIP